MRKKVLLLSIFLIACGLTSFIFRTTENTNGFTVNSYKPPPPGNNDRFLIGTMQSYWDLHRGSNNTNFDAAGLNLTHAYINTTNRGEFPLDPNKHTPVGWVNNNDYLNITNVPVVDIQAKLNEIYSHNQSKVLWMRPKIEWLCFGQSSIYKAFQDNSDYWFYSFNTVLGQEYPDVQWNGGKSVLHCGIPTFGSNAKIVLSRLNANKEQCKRITGDAPDVSNHWQGDSESKWLIKPRIRADMNYINNHYDEPICRIDVYNQGNIQGGIKFSQVILRARHFLVDRDPYNNRIYNGEYLEDNFWFQQNIPEDTANLSNIIGDWATRNDAGDARGNKTETEENNDPNCNHADIQIYWYDNCDLWIDYVKVENDVASDLLSTDPNNSQHQKYEQWITDEVNAVKDCPETANSAVYNFYIEIFEFNNIPCMAHVNERIQTITGYKIGLMGECIAAYNAHVAWNDRGTIMQPDIINRTFFERTNCPTVFLGDPYPLTEAHPNNSCSGFSCNLGNNPYSQLPNTLPIFLTSNGGNNFPINYILGNPSAPTDYDAWLQGLFDTVCANYENGNYNWNNCPPENYGDFMFLMKRGNALSKLSNKPFIPMLQAHQWMSNFEVDREPTNEELDLMTNLAVSYGVKGIVYWMFPSFDSPNPACYYCRGLIDLDNVNPRPNNVYLQPKWINFLQITQRLTNWGPTLMSFDNTQTNSYIYRFGNERSSLFANSYFQDIVTYKPGSQYISWIISKWFDMRL